MAEKLRKDFCTKCRNEVGYFLQKKEIVKSIRGKNYTFSITIALCSDCGEEINIPGLIDKNIQEIDKQYRSFEGLVSIDDIKNLMKIYDIGKTPLSLALGFGEITIPRYLEGQLPSKEYSNVIKLALTSPVYMKQKLIENRNKLTDTAFEKSFKAAENLEDLFCVSSKMLQVIACIFNNLKEVTPLMLQKLLYFIQGVYFALYKKPLFEEDCEAWIHGPVYREVYFLFQDFKYNPIDDARFALIGGTENTLTDDEKRVVDLVAKTFGVYGAKILEKITHNELPWVEARNGYDDSTPSNEILSKKSIMNYYTLIHQQYGIDTEEGLKTHISNMLNKTP